MGLHILKYGIKYGMKTTVELSDQIATEFKARLRSRGLTMKSGLHEAVRMWLDHSRKPNNRISLDGVTVGGNGLSPEFEGKGWDAIRDAIYDTSEVGDSSES